MAPDRITGISVRGFKSICTEQHVEIRPLTVFAGANSSGKSSLMQPLLLLKQTLDSPGDPGAILLDSTNVRFTSADQLLSQFPGKPRIPEFAIKIDLSNKFLEIVYRRGQRSELPPFVWTEKKGIEGALQPAPFGTSLDAEGPE
jgi:hypothetical protein